MSSVELSATCVVVCGRVYRRIVTRIRDRCLARRAHVLPGLVETFHEIAVARLDPGADSSDVHVTDPQNRGASLHSGCDHCGHFGDAGLALLETAARF